MVLKDGKKNVEALNTIFNSKKKSVIGKVDDFEYLFYQELTGGLPNIDKIDLE